MHRLIYYSIFAIILYFILSSVFETFSAEQENFDPSIVPVSSIVTLAKVAQKLVNGNGTLTNPGNLQIGASTSSGGNLTVMGNTKVNGGFLDLNNAQQNFLMINSGATVAADSVRVWKGKDVPTLTFVSSNAANTEYAWPGIVLDTRDSKITATTLQVNGNATVNGNANVGGNIQANGVVNSATLGAGKIQIGNWAGRPALWANDTANSLTIHNDGNKTVQIGASSSYPGNLVVTGSSILNGIIQNNGGVDDYVTIGGTGGGGPNPCSLTVRGKLKVGYADADTHKGADIIGNLNVAGTSTISDKVEIQGGKLQVNGSFNTNDKNLNVDNALIVNGGGIIVNGNLGTIPIKSWSDQHMIKKASVGTLHMGKWNGHDDFDIIMSKAGSTLLLNSDNGYIQTVNNSMNVDKDLNVGGNLNVKGVTKTHLTVIESPWDDNQFLDRMAPYFSKSDPDGTMIGFMFTGGGINGNLRVQYGIKVGDRILRAYHGWWDGHDCGGGCANHAASNDVWRRNIP